MKRLIRASAMEVMTELIIFGEAHGVKEDVDRIKEEVRKINPDFLLLEMLYEDEVWYADEALKKLKDCKVGGLCDPTLNKDWYEFALELDKPCIGIDIDNKTIARLPISRQFEVREKHMVEMIKDYMITGKVVVVVGDTHLRTIKTNELGEISLLQKEFKDVAKIIRSRFSEIK